MQNYPFITAKGSITRLLNVNIKDADEMNKSNLTKLFKNIHRKSVFIFKEWIMSIEQSSIAQCLNVKGLLFGESLLLPS